MENLHTLRDFISSEGVLYFYDLKNIFESSSEWILTINILITEAYVWKLFPEIFKAAINRWWEVATDDKIWETLNTFLKRRLQLQLELKFFVFYYMSGYHFYLSWVFFFDKCSRTDAVICHRISHENAKVKRIPGDGFCAMNAVSDDMTSKQFSDIPRIVPSRITW